ncbi:uncharacterized protein [Penaeus vannamei]|uniref:uncharacterized protein n=1 Tax=Penaeus vannamei TaxID=6689 RepID=UPI00387F9708
MLVVALVLGILVNTETKPAPSPQILSYSVPSPILPGVLGGHVLPPVVHPMAPGFSCPVIPSMCHQPVSLPMMYHPPPAVLAPRPLVRPVQLPMVLPHPPVLPMLAPHPPVLPVHPPMVLPHPRRLPVPSPLYALQPPVLPVHLPVYSLHPPAMPLRPPMLPISPSMRSPTMLQSQPPAYSQPSGTPPASTPSELLSSAKVVYLPTPEGNPGADAGADSQFVSALPPQGSYGSPSTPDADPSKGDMSSMLSMMSSLNGFGYSSASNASASAN